MDEIKDTTEAPKVCPECKRRDDIQERIAELLTQVLAKVQGDTTGQVKATIPEIVKLLQLNREYQQDRVKEIRVKWVTTKKESQSAA